jgi:hypothetical protein
MNEGDGVRREQGRHEDESKAKQSLFEPLQHGPWNQRPSDE